jgi:hypothetical protein
MIIDILDENGEIVKPNTAIVYAVRDTGKDETWLMSDVNHTRIALPLWCYAEEAVKIIKKYNLKVINRSGKCLTFLNEQL